VKACLAATIVDGLAAVIVLLKSRGNVHADTINRYLVEALCDLYHLCASAAFLDSLQLTSAIRQKVIAEAYV
jgi:hypothetical protein